MKNALLLFGGVILIASGCTERSLLRGAEKYLKEHIGDANSYEPIYKEIADTTFSGEIEWYRIFINSH